MVYRLEEFLVVHNGKTSAGKRLRRATNELHLSVVKRLSKLNARYELRRCRSAASAPLHNAAASPFSGAALSRAVVFRPAFSDTRPRSFLISPELALAREQQQQRERRRRQSASETSRLSTPKTRSPTLAANTQSPLSKEEIENRWTRLLMSEGAPAASKTDRDALRFVSVALLPRQRSRRLQSRVRNYAQRGRRR